MNMYDYHNSKTGFRVTHLGDVIDLSGLIREVNDAEAAIKALQEYVRKNKSE